MTEDDLIKALAQRLENYYDTWVRRVGYAGDAKQGFQGLARECKRQMEWALELAASHVGMIEGVDFDIPKIELRIAPDDWQP